MTKRTFIPGSEWLYLRLYTGKLSADTILTEWLLPTYNALISSRLVLKMFFLRFADPEFHLRIRFLLSNKTLCGEALGVIYSTLQSYSESGIVWKIEIGTYEREIERYAGVDIEHIEAIFACDSIYTIRSLESFSPSERWKLSCTYIEQLFDALEFPLSKRRSTMETMQSLFRKEKKLDSPTRINRLNLQYRKLRKSVEEMLSIHMHDEHYIALSRIIKQDTSNRTALYVADIIHMINNRIFVSFPRHNEAVLYYYLFKSYSSLVARSNEQ